MLGVRNVAVTVARYWPGAKQIDAAPFALYRRAMLVRLFRYDCVIHASGKVPEGPTEKKLPVKLGLDHPQKRSCGGRSLLGTTIRCGGCCRHQRQDHDDDTSDEGKGHELYGAAVAAHRLLLHLGGSEAL